MADTTTDTKKDGRFLSRNARAALALCGFIGAIAAFGYGFRRLKDSSGASGKYELFVGAFVIMATMVRWGVADDDHGDGNDDASWIHYSSLLVGVLFLFRGYQKQNNMLDAINVNSGSGSGPPPTRLS
jgi:hypothetical protein